MVEYRLNTQCEKEGCTEDAEVMLVVAYNGEVFLEFAYCRNHWKDHYWYLTNDTVYSAVTTTLLQFGEY